MASLEELQRALDEKDARRQELQGVLGTPTLPDVQSLPEVGFVPTNDLGITAEQAFKLALGFVVERDEAKRGQIAEAAVPGLKADSDKDGNVILTFPNGKQASINRPGPSFQDVDEVANVVLEAGITLLGTLAGGAAAGPPGAIGGATTTAGALSVASDLLSGELGSDREVSVAKAAVSAGLAGLFEAAGPFVFAGLKKVFERGGQFLKPGPAQTLQLTREGKAALQQLGISADELTPQTLKELGKVIDEAATPEEALRLSQARGLDIPITRGQVSRQASDQTFERAGTKGAFGDQAAGVFQTFERGQREAIEEAGKEVSRRVGGSGTLDPGDGIEIVRAKIRGDAQALKAKVDAAYTLAKEKNAQVLAEGVETTGSTVRAVFDDEFGSLGLSRVEGLVKELEGFAGDAVPVKKLERLRQQLSTISRKSSDEVEATAAGRVIDVFDEALGKAVDDALLVGDTQAVAAFKEARELRVMLRQRYESDNIVKALIKEGDDATLLLTPHEALNRLFGAGVLGKKEGAARAVQQVRELLGPNSPEFRALKEEALLRLLRPTGQSDELPGRLLNKRLSDALREAPEVMKTLFGKDELGQIRTLGRVIDDINKPVPGAENFSNTSIVNRALDSMNFVGRTTRSLVENVLLPITFGSSRQRAVRAVSAPLGTPARQTGAGAITEALPTIDTESP